MFFHGLENLLARSPGQGAVIEELDGYLRRLGEASRETLNPRILAVELRKPLGEIIDLLEAGVDGGVFRRRYHVFCPVEQAGLLWLESLSSAPQSFDCDVCNQGPHEYTPEDIAVRYALLSGRAIPAAER